jgi:hypothetical protein
MPNFIICKIDDLDWDEIIDVQFRAFAKEVFCSLVHGKDTPKNREVCKQQYLDSLSQHSNQLWLKVVDVDRAKIVGVAQYKLNPTHVQLKRQELNGDAMVWLEDEEDKRIAIAMINNVQDRKLKYLKEAHIC